MKQLFMDVKTGKPVIMDVPAPSCKKNGIVVETIYSLVSAGTERMLMDFGKKSLIGKAKERPDQVKKVLDKMKTDGALTTVKAAFGKLGEPLPLGYSSVGKVIEVGSNLSDIKPGDFVACAGLSATHSEVSYVPKNLFVKLPENVKDLREAAFVTLGTVAMQGVRQAEVQFGDWVAVIGMGLLGQISARILKAAGCKVIGVDVNNSKEILAKRDADYSYIDAFVNSSEDNAIEKIMTLTGYGCDSIIITAATSSNQPIDLSAEIARDRAIISMVGVTNMEIPRRPFYQKELTFRLSRSYGPGRYDPNYEDKGIDYPIGYIRWTENRNMQEFLDMISSSRITLKELITHEFEIEKSHAVYEMITDNSNNEKYTGVLLKYSEKKDKLNRTIHLKTDFKKPKDKIGVGFIGAGNFTRGVIIPNMSKVKDFEFIGLATTSGTSAGQTIKNVSFKYSTTEYKKLLNDSEIDLIVVATPHSTHAKFTVEALNAGKHVYVEKPLAITKEQLEEVKTAYEKNDQHIFVGFNRRYSPFAKFIKENMETDKYPCVIQYTVNAGFIPKEHWTQDPEVGGGRIIGEACHFVDLAAYLTTSNPKKATSMGINTNSNHISDSDNVSLNVLFENGSVLNIIYTSMGSKTFPKETITIFCNGKVGTIQNFIKANVYGEKKQRLSKMEQQKGFIEEYSNIVSVLKGNIELSDNTWLQTTKILLK